MTSHHLTLRQPECSLTGNDVTSPLATDSRHQPYWGPPGVLGSWGDGLFIFRELGSTANYFRGAGEQAHTFGD